MKCEAALDTLAIALLGRRCLAASQSFSGWAKALRRTSRAAAVLKLRLGRFDYLTGGFALASLGIPETSG